MAEETETETTPKVLADMISLVTGVTIPAAVIATWTPREREDAAAWASAEHLSASGNEGVQRAEQPELVSLALGLTASPALAQLAVEGWLQAKERMESGQFPAWDEMADDLVRAAQAAVTGLIVLLGPARQDEAPTWQHRALHVLGRHPGGIRAVDLFALLGQSVPSQRALDEWLAHGHDMGVLVQVADETWAVADPGTVALVRRKRPAATGVQWREAAAEALRRSQGGMRVADLMAALGPECPSRMNLDAWLLAGEADGTLDEIVPGTWRLRKVRL